MSGCEKSYRRNGHLLRHERLEHPEKSLPSSLQNSSDNYPQDLTNEALHVCSVCQATFKLKENMKRHFLAHTTRQLTIKVLVILMKYIYFIIFYFCLVPARGLSREISYNNGHVEAPETAT